MELEINALNTLIQKLKKAVACAFEDKDSWEVVETLEAAGFTQEEMIELGYASEVATVNGD